MSNRATEQDVLDIMDTNLTKDQVTPFLRAANAMVDDVLVNEEYGTTLLMEIERWLAAHLVAIRDPQVSQEKIGEATYTYHGKSGMGLNATTYGQQVMILDYQGKFKTVQNAKTTAEVRTIR